MPIDPAIVSDNTAQLQRLEAMAKRHIDLNRNLGGGWTVAVAFAHMAFWDRMAEQRLHYWQQHGKPPTEADDDMLNTALLEEWRSIPPQQAVTLAVSAARAANAVVETVGATVAGAIVAHGNAEWLLLNRARHRREHLDQIERAIGA